LPVTQRAVEPLRIIMRPLPRLAWIYIWLLAVLAGVSLMAAFPVADLSQPDRLVLIALCILGLYLTGTHGIPVGVRVTVTVSTVIIFAALLILDVGAAAWSTAIGMSLAYLRLRRRWYNTLFNASAYVLTVFAAGMAYYAAGGGTTLLLRSSSSAAALVLAGLTYFLTNTGLVALVVDLRERRIPASSWLPVARAVGAEYLSLILLGILAALLYDINRILIVLVIIPAIIVYHSYQTSHDLREQTQRAIEAMADVIDKRDPSTFHHSQRVALYAERIAVGLGLSAEQLDLVRNAARIHDLGKIGVSNEMLFKPGPLSELEIAQFRKHPVIGAEIVQRFPQYREGRELILYHHEHFDGKGYPAGKQGEEIPLGARVLTVADAFDAMTSDRPYRTALSYDAAFDELQRESGHQFDPRVVDAFVKAVSAEDLRAAEALRAENPRTEERPAPEWPPQP
jgi:putative nucleotidyltransferase with HDIG domain